jgi:hypothetical protein
MPVHLSVQYMPATYSRYLPTTNHYGWGLWYSKVLAYYILKRCCIRVEKRENKKRKSKQEMQRNDGKGTEQRNVILLSTVLNCPPPPPKTALQI